MDQAFSEVENTDPAQHQRWLDKHGFKPSADGTFTVDSFEGKTAVDTATLFENIKTNVSIGYYTPLDTEPYDERTFVMICGGPSTERYLDEIRCKSRDERYFVVCSNMTGGYLKEHGITPQAHFILDPQQKKKYDVTPDKTSPGVEYWLNVACHPSVFAELKEQGIKPKAFLADFDEDGRVAKGMESLAVQTVKESMMPGQPGMMAVQGGTMAGLRAINLADALGFRAMEYYGFDATVEVRDGKAKPYAYEKKRGEAIIEVQCDRCDAKFDTTLIFQKQVNEFLQWRANMPWMDITIIGGGLIDHCKKHAEDLERAVPSTTARYTPQYEALQRALHDKGSYGVSGVQYMPSIFHAVSQLVKRHGSASVLDYGSAGGNTMRFVRERYWMPPAVTDTCYDPFVDDYSKEPEMADLVICTDVLEHVEPQCTKAVLDHIASLTRRIAFFSIALKKANKTLDDGRNAHINLRSSEFWLKEIKKRFIMSEAKVSGDGEVVLAVAQSINDVKETVRRNIGHERRAA